MSGFSKDKFCPLAPPSQNQKCFTNCEWYIERINRCALYSLAIDFTEIRLNSYDIRLALNRLLEKA